MEYHINIKEILAVKFSLKTFVIISDAYVKLLSDNITTVHGINNMHSTKSDLCHSIIFDIWAWTEDKSIWNTTSYISRTENYEADPESRKNLTVIDA